MPSAWTLETLPEPNDARVLLRAIPARTIAVLRYSGTWSQSRYEEPLKKLQDALQQAGLPWHGEAVWARYDPPWTPWFWRRNEILLKLDGCGSFEPRFLGDHAANLMSSLCGADT